MLKIQVVGDSISHQYTPYLETYIGGLVNYGWSGGGDSIKVLGGLVERRDAGELNEDVLLLNCGLHDIKTDPQTLEKQVLIEDYEQNLRQIVALLKAAAVELLWLRTTPCDEAVHNKPGRAFHRFAADCAAYNGVADRIMDEAGVAMIDLHGFTRQLGSEVYCDHVHFHEPVREKQAAYIAGWIACWLDCQPSAE
jgi:hypothetical protein